MRNSREIHSDGISHRVLIFVSELMKNDYLIAGAITHLDNLMLIKSVQKGWVVVGQYQKRVDTEYSDQIVKILGECNGTKTVEVDLSKGKIVNYLFVFEKLGVEVEALSVKSAVSDGDYMLFVIDMESKVWLKLVVLCEAEGERKFRVCMISRAGIECFLDRHGYICSKKGNSREVCQEEKLCRSYICINLISVDDEISEAKESTHQEKHMMEEMVINDCYNSLRRVVVSKENNALMEINGKKFFAKRFEFLKIEDWLLLFLMKFEEIFFVGDNLMMEFFDVVLIRDRIDGTVMNDGGSGNGMSLALIMPLVRKLRCFDYYLVNFNLPTLISGNVFISIYPTGGQIKSDIHNIEHPVVFVSQRSPFSSEDG
jgi:hypothetical protein